VELPAARRRYGAGSARNRRLDKGMSALPR
jgi:hypothetical protein